MEDVYEIVDIPDDDSPEEHEEGSIPWKPIMAAFVAGATSTALLATIRKLRKKTPDAPAEDSQVVEGIVIVTPPAA